MAAAFALLAGILLPCWSASAKFTKGSVKGNGVECSHHSECFSDCCLMNLDAKAAFCAPKTRINKVCLPQVSKKPTQTSLDDEGIICGENWKSRGQ
ncbi:colipase-like protein 2 isoform X2 [Manis pentadactyla]|uniref:colipase-like protein 2 isoform X2 n=1 Tax=Manis pentadactyla TaxID=143292 RepID=UPI0018753099|nr:colipase-like protein 2 isoform X2 [Manis pentadactyla]XP_057350248.1 colipase-like protein 2 isoform X2 [Manis pentadactyla]KAI5186296.1 Colipase-Like Protein 2 [Manis pentadactyla]